MSDPDHETKILLLAANSFFLIIACCGYCG